ncbi:MAG: hypothetical protein PVG75_14860 [Thioalkalispiraceae bacterium]|jgi:hypothetical protein
MVFTKSVRFAGLACLFLLMINLVACGDANEGGPDIETLPVYPGAVAGESMQDSAFAGLMSGHIRQFTTTDNYSEVASYYEQMLEPHNPQVMRHESELGRQMAFSIEKGTGGLTVTIQEFKEENSVAITFMSVNM